MAELLQVFAPDHAEHPQEIVIDFDDSFLSCNFSPTDFVQQVRFALLLVVAPRERLKALVVQSCPSGSSSIWPRR